MGLPAHKSSCNESKRRCVDIHEPEEKWTSPFLLPVHEGHPVCKYKDYRIAINENEESDGKTVASEVKRNSFLSLDSRPKQKCNGVIGSSESLVDDVCSQVKTELCLSAEEAENQKYTILPSPLSSYILKSTSQVQYGSRLLRSVSSPMTSKACSPVYSNRHESDAQLVTSIEFSVPTIDLRERPKPQLSEDIRQQDSTDELTSPSESSFPIANSQLRLNRHLSEAAKHRKKYSLVSYSSRPTALTVDSEEDPKTRSTEESSKKPRCKKCRKRFSSKQSLRNHRVRSRKEYSQAICAICNKKYCLFSDLKRHVTKHADRRQDEGGVLVTNNQEVSRQSSLLVDILETTKMNDEKVHVSVIREGRPGDEEQRNDG